MEEMLIEAPAAYLCAALLLPEGMFPLVNLE